MKGLAGDGMSREGGAERFDTVTQPRQGRPGRRGLLLGIASAFVASLPLASRNEVTLAKKGKGKKKKNKKRAGSGQTTPPPTPPPPPAASGPTCADGMQNGSETAIDCGGPTCPRCDIGRTCQGNRDCRTGRCGDGNGFGNTCESCSGDGICGQDANGGCRCDQETGICMADIDPTSFVNNCNLCPAGFVCRNFFEGLGCIPPCGS